MVSEEFKALGKILIRQIADAVDEDWWFRNIPQQLVEQFNNAATESRLAEGPVFQFTEQTMNGVREFGFIWRDPRLNDVCNETVAQWELKSGTYKLKRFNKSARKKAIIAISSWIELKDS